MKRILFILFMLTTCLLSPYAQKQRTGTKKPVVKQQTTKKTVKKQAVTTKKTTAKQTATKKPTAQNRKKNAKGNTKQKYVTTEEIKGLQKNWTPTTKH